MYGFTSIYKTHSRIATRTLAHKHSANETVAYVYHDALFRTFLTHLNIHDCPQVSQVKYVTLECVQWYHLLILVWPTCRTPSVGGLIVCERVSE